MSSDLLAFLRARLDEDEFDARRAPGRNWSASVEDDIAGASVYDEQWRLLEPTRYDHNEPLSNRLGATGPQYIERSRDALAAHIARHDPSRVLREVEAKRRLVDDLEELMQRRKERTEDFVRLMRDPERNRERLDERRREAFGWELDGRIQALRHAVEILAAVYSDHPDCNQDWAPWA